MAWGRAALGLAVAVVLAATLVSGGSREDSVRLRYLPESNELRTVVEYGRARDVDVRSLGAPGAIGADPRWLARARPLGPGAPPWARRMYRRSLLVLRAVTDQRSGAVVAGFRDGWEYVWPRDAGTVAIALASAGYRAEAWRVARFLLGLDLGAAARFHDDGTPVDGRAVQGDAAGWVAAAARAVGLRADVALQPWRDRADYQEGESGDYLTNAIASTAGEPKGTSAGDLSVRRPAEREIRREFGVGGMLVREAGDSESGLDSAAAWAVRPFAQPALFPAVRRTLLRIAADGSRYGIIPSESWEGGDDPWTAPTAWTAWSLAALGERRAALRLMAAMRRVATPVGMLPERVDSRTGIPTSTTPLAWSHAFAILAIRELWP
ncbi:MAG TPA: hypothetical protein VID51_04130 [Solirubrobacterales bacterium]|jgi:hypothetical protein